MAEIFGRSHARLGTRVRLIAWRSSDAATLLGPRLAAVQATLERFDIPRERIQVELREVGQEYYLRDVISVEEIVPPAELERRRVAHSPNILC